MKNPYSYLSCLGVGQISLPVSYFVMMHIVANDAAVSDKKFSKLPYYYIKSKTVLLIHFVMLCLLFGVNMSNGIKGLTLIERGEVAFYSPIYGEGGIILLYIILQFSINAIFGVITSFSVIDKDIRAFMITLNIAVVAMMSLAFLNTSQYFYHTVGVLSEFIFCLVLVAAFLQLKSVEKKKNKVATQFELQKKVQNRNSAALIHELNNVSSVLALVTYVKNGELTKDEEKQALEEVELASDHLINLIQKFEDTQTYQTPEIQESNIIAVVNDSIKLIKNHKNVSGGEIAISYKDIGKGRIDIDPLQIKQVLINLIKNGMEAERDNLDSLRTVNVEIDLKHDYYYIDIIDNGTGIHSGSWDKVFKPFLSTKDSGTGLGLPLCKDIIENHRGRIVVEESSELGTTMRVILPKYNENVGSVNV
ncbi:HAMP domain-containing sensor histidine kinase (plasmid) [Rossellomorea sp. AcN35-11]|nr:HAMP domain-containing sensor histidine kinase [Rossellomorea sp. AcN35-11]